MVKKALIALALVLAATFAIAPVATAQVSGEVADVTTPSQVRAGEQFRIFGSGCISGTVDVTFNGQTFRGVPVDAQGNWFLDVNAPGTPGTYTVSSNCGGTVATTTVEVLSGAAAPAALARTGDSSTTPLARIGLGAVVAGGLLLAATRRRRAIA
jgi:LPXTG-motif cell wall-anchored protein